MIFVQLRARCSGNFRFSVGFSILLVAFSFAAFGVVQYLFFFLFSQLCFLSVFSGSVGVWRVLQRGDVRSCRCSFLSRFPVAAFIRAFI